jgi:LPS-assembly lipoprotein
MLSSNLRFAIRLLAVVTLGAMTAGCFQPMYGEHTLAGGPGLREKLSAIDLADIKTATANDARLAVELRNGLSFAFTGGSGTTVPTHTLSVKMNTSRTSVIVDVNTSRPDIEQYGIDVSYSLKEIATGKVVLNANTFARVSYDIPGQEQRFARVRGLRDAESRAVRTISDNITQRLASYFVAGT